MAGKKTKHGSTKRFGPRYGRTLKNKIGKIEQQQKRPQRCPQCRYQQVSRESKGIWTCKKCGAKFTSKAYSVAKMPSLKPETKE
ncbi:50S ribosomal protein L37ae [Candidatus Woesearchaeota archaeon]|nr:50S ribosomal protein L37ae [Candidatus Woesearchaeota archaeon]